MVALGSRGLCRMTRKRKDDGVDLGFALAVNGVQWLRLIGVGTMTWSRALLGMNWADI